MIQIKRVLYLSSEKTVISCDHEALVFKIWNNNMEAPEITRIPTTLLEQIVIFGETQITSPVIHFCNKHHIIVNFISYYGNYYGRICGKTLGNILLRKRQYEIYNDEYMRLNIVKNIILGKCLNELSVIAYHMHNSKTEGDIEKFKHADNIIREQLARLKTAKDIDECRGYEGVAASSYFSVFDTAIKINDPSMLFITRSKRPPENNCNALLSFLYTMLNLNCVAALETFGLDSYLGYLHSLRPGRESLACDLLEEFRAPFVDRFVIALINRKQIQSDDFETINGNIRLKDSSRKKLLQLWEAEKNNTIYYGYFQKDIPIKIVPYLQAQLLSQHIRGDISEYPPFYWEWK